LFNTDAEFFKNFKSTVGFEDAELMNIEADCTS
jgi:hypothetical protein